MASYPALSVNPGFPIIEDREDSTIRSDFEGGYQHTRPRFTRSRRRFGISYKSLPDTDKTLLESFVSSVRGGAISFDWTHPKTLQPHIVRFDKAPQFSYVANGYWDTQFTLVEV